MRKLAELGVTKTQLPWQPSDVSAQGSKPRSTQVTQIIKLNGKLPRVVWHPSGRQFSSRIGFKQYKRKAIRIATDWDWTVQFFNESRPGEKPYWLGEPRCGYISYKQDLNHVVKFIASDIPLSRVMRSDFERFVNGWMALPKVISIRTAVNYCTTLK